MCAAPYHPASNGLAERFVRTFKQAMKAGKHDGQTQQHQLENFLFTYCTTPHATTGVTPCSLFLGRDLRTKLTLIQPDVERRVREKQAAQKHQHDQHARERSFAIGQKVMVKNLRPGPAWIPEEITKQLGPVTFSVLIRDGQTWKRHVDHLKTSGDHCLQGNSSNELEESAEFMDIMPNSDTHQPTESAQQATTTSNTSPRYPTRNRHPPDRLM